MSLTVNIRYQGFIDSLIHRCSYLSELKDKNIIDFNTDDVEDYVHGISDYIPEDKSHLWTVPENAFWGYQKEAGILPIMLIGKSGYGKSSLLNCMIGQTVFPVDDINPCTKEIDGAFFQLGNASRDYIALYDMPGIGESEQADRKYMEWYTEMVEFSPCVIYVLRADQRDYSIDSNVFKVLFPEERNLEKVIIALNFADKIEPVNRKGGISQEQEDALDEKIEIISDIFSVDTYNIIPCCAHDGYGIEELLCEATENLLCYLG